TIATRLLHGQEEPHNHRREEEIDESAAGQKQYRRSNKEWQKRHALMLVEAGSHKLVNLRSDNRERQNNTAEHRDLDLREEEFLRCGIDQLGFRAIHTSPVERPLIGNDEQI